MTDEQMKRHVAYLADTIKELKARIVGGETKESTVQALINTSFEFMGLANRYIEILKKED